MSHSLLRQVSSTNDVLNGRGIVFTYEDDNVGKYFYRELKEGTKLYQTKLIEGATTLEAAKEKVLADAKNLDEAELLAADTAIALRDELKNGKRIEELYDPMYF